MDIIKSSLQSKKLLSLLTFSFLTIFISGIFYPNDLWGSHYLAFVPVSTSIILGICCVVCLFVLPDYWLEKSIGSLDKAINNSKLWQKLFPIILSLVGLVWFLNSQIQSYIYGDAIKLLGYLALPGWKQDSRIWSELLDFNIISAKNGIDFTLALVMLLSKLFGLSYIDSFTLIGVVSGAVWLWLIYAFLDRIFTQVLLKFSLYLAFFTAGLTGVFRGDIEVYAIPIVLHTAFIALAMRHLGKPKSSRYYWLLLVWIFDMKVHSTAILLLPLLLAATYTQYFNTTAKSHLRFWLNGILIPGSLLFLYLYFVGLGSYSKPHVNSGPYNVLETLFLPLFPSAPPLDRYTVFSIAHITDYAQVFFHNGASLLFVGFLVITYRKQIPFRNPQILAAVSTLFIISGFYFMVNCTLGMPRDWDMLALPVVSSALCIVILLASVQDKIMNVQWITKSIIAISLISSTMFYVNAHPVAAQMRVMAIGFQTYKHYYAGGTYPINVAIGALKLKPEGEIALRNRIMGQLMPYSAPQQDMMMSNWEEKIGSLYFGIKNYSESTVHYKKADKWFPNQIAIQSKLAVNAFFLKNYQEAYGLASKVLLRSHQDIVLLDIALISASKLGQSDEAKILANKILAINKLHKNALAIVSGKSL